MGLKKNEQQSDAFKATYKEAINLAKKGELKEALERLSQLALDIDILIAAEEQARLMNALKPSDSNIQPLNKVSIQFLGTDALNYLKYSKASLHYNMALILYNLKKLDEALIKVNETIDQLRVIKPIKVMFFLDILSSFKSTILNLKGVILLKLSYFETAIQYFKESIHYEYNFDALNNMGICYAELEETDDAIRSLRNGIENEKRQIENEVNLDKKENELSKVAKAVLNLAFVYFIIGYKEEAFDCITKGLEELFGKENKQTHSIYDKFEEWLKSIVTAFNLSSRDLYIIGLILYMKNQDENALTVLEEALASDKSTNPYLWYQKGNIYIKQGDYSEALRCYRRAAEIKPNIAEAHNNAAVVLAHDKNYDESRRELAKAIKVNPSLSVAHENLVRLTVNDKTKSQDFWQFWGSSRKKESVAMALSLLAAAIVIFGIASPFFGSTIEPTELNNIAITKNIKSVNDSKIISTTEETTSSNNKSESLKTPEIKIPESYLVIVALVVLIILSPQLKSLKAGPVEVELQTRESVDIDTTLHPAQEAFISQGGYIEPPDIKS